GPGAAPRGQARAGVAARAARAPPRSSRRSCPPGRAPRDSIEYAGPFTGHHVRIRHHPVPARTQERAPAPRVRAAARPGHLVGPPPEPREPEAPSRIAGAPAGLRLLPEPGRRVNRAERADAADEAIDPQAAEAPPVPMPGEQLELKVFARLYGEPVVQLPQDLYIPPDALEVFLDSFEGPLDLLLYLIRKQNFNVLDIPMAEVTRQYLAYIEEIRQSNLELAAEYLLMAALLIDIKSRMLLPVRKADTDEEAEDPRAELARRLLEYERIKYGAQMLDAMPVAGRDFLAVQAHVVHDIEARLPGVDPND